MHACLAICQPLSREASGVVRQGTSYLLKNVKLALFYCSTHLHNPHQHHQNGYSCGKGLVCWDTLVADQNLRYTGHHPGRSVHCQHQTEPWYKPCHLHQQSTNHTALKNKPRCYAKLPTTHVHGCDKMKSQVLNQNRSIFLSACATPLTKLDKHNYIGATLESQRSSNLESSGLEPKIQVTMFATMFTKNSVIFVFPKISRASKLWVHFVCYKYKKMPLHSIC